MNSAASEAFKAVGTVLRSHGLNGEMVIKPEVNNPVFLEEIILFYVRNERGDFFPMRVEYSKMTEKNNKYTFFVKFEQITDKNGVDEFKNRVLFVSSNDFKLADQNEMEVEYDFIDFDLVSEQGDEYGVIVDIIDNPAHPILEVTGPKGHFMIPFVEEYIVGYDINKHHIIGKNIDRLVNL